MRPPTVRELGAQTLVVVAAGIGVSIGLLGPLKSDLDTARLQLAESLDLAARASQLSAETPAETRAATLQAEKAWVLEQSALAFDTARLHERIVALAAKARVQLDRVQPKELAAIVTPGDVAKIGLSPASTLTCLIDARGTYPALNDFIASLGAQTGISRTASVRITPILDSGSDEARAVIETMHYQFSFPAPPVAAVAGGPATEAPQ